jgi:hypothetical protein
VPWEHSESFEKSLKNSAFLCDLCGKKAFARDQVKYQDSKKGVCRYNVCGLIPFGVGCPLTFPDINLWAPYELVGALFLGLRKESAC